MNPDQAFKAIDGSNQVTVRKLCRLEVTMLIKVGVGCRLLIIILNNVSGLSLVDSQCYRVQEPAYTSQSGSSQPLETRLSVICENLGVLSQVPDFPSSYNGTYELVIRNGTTILVIQAAAFANCGTRRLVLVSLGITLVDPRAFSGLELTLEYLDLGSNDVSKLHPDTFTSLQRLTVLVLDGNRIYAIPDGLLATPRSLDRVDLRHNRIASLASPSGLFGRQQYLQTLLRGGNILGALGNSSFKGLGYLRTLDLSDNGLSDLDYSTFRYVELLMTLNLRNNRLTVIPSTICQYLQYLVDLDLSSNEVGYLSEDVFKGCPALKLLNVSENSLNALPNRSIEILHELHSLDLSGNNLSTFRWAQLQNLQLLAELNLSRNGLSSLPSGAFFYNDNLRSLNLSSNLLSSLPPGMFSSSNSLETLDLSRNWLTFADIVSLQAVARVKDLLLWSNKLEGVVPDRVFQNLVSLEHLDLNFNQISQVARDSFTALPQLRRLLLNHNRLVTIADDAFVGNFNLSFLSVTGNLLQDLSRLGSNSLRVLRADHNNVTDLQVIGTLAYLEELHLRNNQISNIPLTFTSFRLKLLDLTYNRLQVLELYDLLSCFPFLERLILRGNGIREIQPGTLLGLSSLAELDLSENCLATLKHEYVQSIFQSLLLFTVDHNPLICTCELLWLRSYAPLTNRNDTLCYFANGTSNSWTESSCTSGKNCSGAISSKDDSVFDPSCSRSPLALDSIPSLTFPVCFLPPLDNSSGDGLTTISVDRTKTPITPLAAVSNPSGTPTYVYILIPILGCALTITAAATLLARWRRKRSTKMPIQNNGPHAWHTFPRLAVPFESSKMPNGNGVGRPTNFQLSTLQVRNAMAVRRFGQRYLNGVRGISRE